MQLPTHEGEGPGAPLPARTRREEEEGWFARKSETFAAYMMPTLCLHAAYMLSAAARAYAQRANYEPSHSVGFCPRSSRSRRMQGVDQINMASKPVV